MDQIPAAIRVWENAIVDLVERGGEEYNISPNIRRNILINKIMSCEVSQNIHDDQHIFSPKLQTFLAERSWSSIVVQFYLASQWREGGGVGGGRVHCGSHQKCQS